LHAIALALKVLTVSAADVPPVGAAVAGMAPLAVVNFMPFTVPWGCGSVCRPIEGQTGRI
jgi:hypothetical protein